MLHIPVLPRSSFWLRVIVSAGLSQFGMDRSSLSRDGAPADNAASASDPAAEAGHDRVSIRLRRWRPRLSPDG
jgi:hypothetical protein